MHNVYLLASHFFPHTHLGTLLILLSQPGDATGVKEGLKGNAANDIYACMRLYD